MSLVAAGARAANVSSGQDLFSKAVPAATALTAQAKKSFVQSQNQAEAALDPKTMAELTAVAQKIYQKNGDAWEKSGWWHTRCDIEVNGGGISGGKFTFDSIVIGVSPWKIETKCTTRFLNTKKCFFSQFSPMLMTVAIGPDGSMRIISDPGYGKHTQQDLIDYAKKYAVGFWLGRFDKPVWFPLFPKRSKRGHRAP